MHGELKKDEGDYPGTRSEKFSGAQEKTGRQGVAVEIEDSGLDSRESRPPEFYHLACLFIEGGFGGRVPSPYVMGVV